MERDEMPPERFDAPRPEAPRSDDETMLRAPGSDRAPAPVQLSAADEEARIARERTAPGSIRAEDTEPYVGLQYIARLFKIVSFLVMIAMVLEIVLGVAADGLNALLPLLAEVVQAGVLAAILWGSADVVLLLIDLGHDVRASRVLLGRISARGEQQYGGKQRQRERPRG
jgi:hypothetical protein